MFGHIYIRRGCFPHSPRIRLAVLAHHPFVLARAQLVDPHPEASASDSIPIDEAGVQLTTFRPHSAPDPIAEPLHEPPLIHPHSESEKIIMYGSTSSGNDRQHYLNTSPPPFMGSTSP